MLGGRFDQSYSNTWPHFGLQVFFGFDYDITDNLYAGVNGRYYYINAKWADPSVEVAQMTVLGTLGWRF